MEDNQVIPVSYHSVSVDDSKSPSIAALAAALSKAQGAIEAAKKDTANEFFKKPYADLASVWGACREPLSANGLAVVQTTKPSTEGITVVTTLLHSSGEWMRGELFMKPVKNDPQGIGSAITYARRYALAAMVGVAPDDDDGEGAMGRKNKTPVTGAEVSRAMGHTSNEAPFVPVPEMADGSGSDWEKYADELGRHHIDLEDDMGFRDFWEQNKAGISKMCRDDKSTGQKYRDTFAADRAKLKEVNDVANRITA